MVGPPSGELPLSEDQPRIKPIPYVGISEQRWRERSPHRLSPAERDVSGTPRAAGTPLPGAGTSHPDTARRDVFGGHGVSLVHAA